MYKSASNDWFGVTSLGAKGQISKYVVWCITNSSLKTHRILKLIGLVCLDMFLHCTNYECSMSRDSGSKVKKTKSVANLAQSRAFEPLMLEA